MRKVLVGTPCHSASVHCRYANSLGETIRQGQRIGIEVYPLYIPGNALIHSARNEVVQAFMKSDFDDLVFIDADISWKPDDFFKLLNHQVGAVGATYPYKKSDLQFVMKTSDGKPPVAESNKLMRVQGLGMGFFRMTRATVESLWNASMPYHRSNVDTEYRAAFELPIIDGIETGEDIAMCMKIPEVWLDASIILEHSGDRQHFADPAKWLEDVRAFMAEQERKEKEAGVIVDPVELASGGSESKESESLPYESATEPLATAEVPKE
jgi:glycosyltransferase involved in cell wall biosynthesis